MDHLRVQGVSIARETQPLYFQSVAVIALHPMQFGNIGQYKMPENVCVSTQPDAIKHLRCIG